MSGPDGEGCWICATIGCPNPATVLGSFHGAAQDYRVMYCARHAFLLSDRFEPDRPATPATPTAPAAEADLRYEWAVNAVWEDGDELLERGSEEMARVMADYWNGRDDGPTCTVLRRTITVGPWQPAP